MELLFKAIIKYLIGVLIVALLIFVPAGTLYFYNGLLFMIVLFVPMFIAGLIMYFKSPDLLKSRLNAKEKQNEQKLVLLLSALMFISVFVIAGLNYRHQWHVLPDVVVIIAVIVFLIFYLLYAEVLRENQYLSRTIEVQRNQKVVDTGLYGIIRHPMYFVTVFLFLSMPLILGCLYSFIIMLLYIPIIIKRIINEEKVLEKQLEGYIEYKKKVKYRLIPFIW